uniref:Uncharacterized protein n=1 Tax=Magallana gigas TaxID=29159 RepID=A0A8W8JJG0_MAGGI
MHFVEAMKRFTQEEICHGTNITINVVQKCPENAKTVQMRIIERKCYQYPKCDGEVLVYHCTRFLNNLIEVCSPNGLITGHCCTQFDEGVGRVIEDYSTSCSECPFKYHSNDSSKFSSCIESIQRTSTKSPIKEYANAKDIMDETKQVENRQTTQSIQYDITTEDTELRLTNGSILINSPDVYVITVVIMTMLVYIAICIVIAIKLEK